MKKSLRVLFIVCICVLLLTFVGCNKENKTDSEKIKEDGIINIGITIYQPMDYFDESGETIIGFDADLANEFASSLGVRARFTIIQWDEKIMELNGGYIDLIWNGMTASDELANSIDLSLAYATNYQCVVVKTENVSSYNSQNDLVGKQVAVESGSAGDSVLEGIVTPNRVSAQLDALNEVKSGTSDAAVIDYTMAYSLVGSGEYTNLSIIDASKISFSNEVFAIGARKNSDLTALVNEFLTSKYNDGSLRTLAIKYGVAVNDSAFTK